VDPLPIVPSCSLDEAGSREQRERYRQLADGSAIVERASRRLVIAAGPRPEDAVVAELIGVEQECCPFLELDWDGDRRRLTISVARAEDEPALLAIESALTG
jgi:hypothetical protein